jgi:hypothetical protein
VGKLFSSRKNLGRLKMRLPFQSVPAAIVVSGKFVTPAFLGTLFVTIKKSVVPTMAKV